jgi:hypothetical protein
VAGLRRILTEEYEKCITNSAIGRAQGAAPTGAGFFAGSAALLAFLPATEAKIAGKAVRLQIHLYFYVGRALIRMGYSTQIR